MIFQWQWFFFSNDEFCYKIPSSFNVPMIILEIFSTNVCSFSVVALDSASFNVNVQVKRKKCWSLTEHKIFWTIIFDKFVTRVSGSNSSSDEPMKSDVIIMCRTWLDIRFYVTDITVWLITIFHEIFNPMSFWNCQWASGTVNLYIWLICKIFATLRTNKTFNGRFMQSCVPFQWRLSSKHNRTEGTSELCKNSMRTLLDY